jgi:NAD-dependent dihydropyrimidine dehydrogenase PreA subunit
MMEWYIGNQTIFKEDMNMAYAINDDCVSCGACESECPQSCISQGDGKYVIEASSCVDCGSCADVCPVSAPQKA